MPAEVTVPDTYTAQWHGDTVVLTDHAVGVEVHVCPAFGNTILRFRQRLGADVLDLVVPPEGRSGAAAGIAMRFPFPDRGLVCDCPWEVDSVDASAAGAWLWSTLLLDDPRQPWRCSITVGLALLHGILHLVFEVHNLGDAPMPFGVGAHPWFPATLGGARAETWVRAPGRKVWELDGDGLPTGRTLPVADTRLDLRAGVPLGAAALGAGAFADMHTDLERLEYRGSEAAVSWGDVTMRVEACPAFREWAVHAPASRPVVCLAPSTCAPDAVNLAARGVDAGLLVVAPGARWEGRLTFSAFRGPDRARSAPLGAPWPPEAGP